MVKQPVPACFCLFSISRYVDCCLLVISNGWGLKKSSNREPFLDGKAQQFGRLALQAAQIAALSHRACLFYSSILPVRTRILRNSRWRMLSVRSLPPFWYHWRSQRRDMISSEVKPFWASVSISVVAVSTFVT